MRKTSVENRPETVDEYIAAAPAEARAGLERLRRVIKTTAPDASETISYRMPIYKHRGMLVGFAAFKNHSSFFVMGSRVMNKYRKELKDFETAKGTIRFTRDKPLPVALVRKLVKARIEENNDRFMKRKKREE